MHCCWRAATRPSFENKKEKKYINFSEFNSRSNDKIPVEFNSKGMFFIWFSFCFRNYGFLFVFEIKKSNFFDKNTTVTDVVPCCYEQTAASTSSQENRQHPVSPSGCDEIADQLLRAGSLFDLQKSRVYPGIFCALRKTWKKIRAAEFATLTFSTGFRKKNHTVLTVWVSNIKKWSLFRIGI